MSQSKLKSQNHTKILETEKRCIYCAKAPTQIEHMPPRAMFHERQRPSGLVFASCEDCNNGTSRADLVASFIAHFDVEGSNKIWQTNKIDRWKVLLEDKATGVIAELMRPSKNREILRYSEGSILKPYTQINADGPLLCGYLNVFGAKLGMALFREHVGIPMPMNGEVFSRWYLNSGITQAHVDSILKGMPHTETLRQGKFEVRDQFVYRYNCDEKSVVAAMAKFHDGLFVLTVAMSDSLAGSIELKGPTDSIIKPGELHLKIPPKGPRYWHLQNLS